MQSDLNRMSWRIRLSLLFVAASVGTSALTNPSDFATLKSLKDVWNNVPPNWDSADPCGDSWDGISCNPSNRVVSITLASLNLSGQISSDIEGLSQLQILDLSFNKGMTGSLPTAIGNLKQLTSLILVGCGFSGPIPSSIGSLPQLVYLSLNMNNFVGEIPPTIGNLSSLHWLDLADNSLSGPIPISSGTTLGLDMLFNTKHFLAAYMTEEEVLHGIIYPSISRIRDITKEVAAAVITEAIEEDLAEGYREIDARELHKLNQEEIRSYVVNNMWTPEYPTLVYKKD